MSRSAQKFSGRINLQAAMRREGVTFPAQNAFLAKLAVMKSNVVTH